MKIPFSKLSGAGNDFIVIDNRDLRLNLHPEIVSRLCTRRTGIGADGLILIDHTPEASFSMLYHNADGYPGSMCGNGGRCAVWFAYCAAIPSTDGLHFTFLANNERYEGWVTAPGIVRLKMLEPVAFRHDLAVGSHCCHSVNTGSPHALLFVDDLEHLPVTTIGREIRHRTDFFPGGTNVNFIAVTAPDSLAVRTFERGVEDETLACGTGAVASALMSYRLGKVQSRTIPVRVRSGDLLEVSFDETMSEVFLTGPAEVVYTGEVEL